MWRAQATRLRRLAALVSRRPAHWTATTGMADASPSTKPSPVAPVDRPSGRPGRTDTIRSRRGKVTMAVEGRGRRARWRCVANRRPKTGGDALCTVPGASARSTTRFVGRGAPEPTGPSEGAQAEIVRWSPDATRPTRDTHPAETPPTRRFLAMTFCAMGLPWLNGRHAVIAAPGRSALAAVMADRCPGGAVFVLR